jgi:hypothetical protein
MRTVLQHLNEAGYVWERIEREQNKEKNKESREEKRSA